MTGRILVRPGADPEAVAELRREAEALGFMVTEQARVGRLRVTARRDFAGRFARVQAEMRRENLSLRAAAERLGIGASTLHRLLRAERPAPAPARPRRHPP